MFRFNIDGQAFTAKACGFDEKNNAQNAGIATAVENFCHKNVHPIQTNAVFFALAQVERWQKILGGLREAENTLDSRTASENAAFDLSAFLQV